MNYTIKEIVRTIDITEQGLYKRIRKNYDLYLKEGLIVSKPGDNKKEQIFITDKGLKDLLKTRAKRTITEDQETQEAVSKPGTKPQTKPTKLDTEDASQSLLNLLNQNIEDLKEENKRLNEKLDKQEARFEEKLEKQEKSFKEQLQRQEEIYTKTLDKIMNNFNQAMQMLPQPQSQEEQEPIQQEQVQETIFAEPGEAVQEEPTGENIEPGEAEPKGIKKFFKFLFRG